MGQKLEHILVQYALRIGVLLFLFPSFYELAIYPDLNRGPLGNSFMILIFAAYLALIVLFFLIKYSNFTIIGFLLVFVSSVYSFVDSILAEGISGDLTAWVLLMIISVYFISKKKRKNSKRRVSHHHH